MVACVSLKPVPECLPLTSHHCPPRAVARRASPAVLSAPGSMPRQKYPTPRVRGPHAFRGWISSGQPRRRVDGRQPSRDAISHSGRYVVSMVDHRVVLLSFRHPDRPVMERRRFNRTQSLEERLAKERLRAEAILLPSGAIRDEMIRRARQAETGSHMSEWLRCRGLRSPD
jgi:hypothetical protein